MALTIKSLAKGTLPAIEGDLYYVPVGKAAIVKNIRLVSTGTGPAIVNLYVRRATGGTSYRLHRRTCHSPVVPPTSTMTR